MFTFLLFTCCCITISLTHNIDLKVGPILKTNTPASYFGFSATGVIDGNKQPWVAVGSPRANTSRLNGRTAKYDNSSTGALFRCPITMDQSDCRDVTKKYVFSGSLTELDPNDGWYGVTVSGGRQEDGKLMVCSHKILVRLCRLVGTCTYSMPGICLNLDKDGSSDSEIRAIDNINDKDFNGKSGDTVSLSYERYRFGETGIGATVVDDDCYSSAIGSLSWTGSVVTGTKINVALNPLNQKYQYAGYSLAAGSFYGVGSKNFAIGAPRHNVTGAVFVNETLGEENKQVILIPGEQYGSYFGMAVCAGDFDGDNMSEIVVGAPYFTQSVSVPSVGKVYVYSSKDQFKKPVRTYKSPKPQAHALFGKAVAVIGDLDRSGYNDMIIGSPYEGEGGVVYIYHGSAQGILSEAPVQIIKASDFPSDLKTFGWSVRGETDLDFNGYPDIVVGAYASDSIMILRSVPVVDVDIEYQLSSPTIDVSNKSCTINDPVLGQPIQTVCFEVEVLASYVDRAGKMTDPIEISFTLDADTLVDDTNEKRVRFETSQSPLLTVNGKSVQQGSKTRVLKAKAYLRVDQCPECEEKINPYPDIQLKVAPELPDRKDPPSPPTSGPALSLQPYFQLPYSQHEDVKNFTETTIQIKRACEPCEPNLMIKNTGTTKIPVQAKDRFLEVEIGNSADEAYAVTLTVDFPPPLLALRCTKKQCVPGCTSYKNESQLVCDLGNFPKTTKKYTIKVDTSKASYSLETYQVTMNVSSDNKEAASLLEDNSLTLELNVASEADIYMSSLSIPAARYYGGSVRGQFAMESEDQIGLKVDHVYSVNSNGPDLVPEVNITIEWPYQAKNGKRLLYLVNITGGDIDSGKAKCFPDPNMVNLLASQFKDDSNRRRRDVDDSNGDPAPATGSPNQGRKGSDSKIVLDCANGTAVCISIPCTLSDVAKNTKVEVIIESRIWNGTLLEDYTDRDVYVVSRGRIDDLTSYVTDNVKKDHDVKTTTSFFPDAPKTIKKDIAVWIIIVSAIAGVVLLIILVVVFKMCGFFNRSGARRYDAVPEN